MVENQDSWPSIAAMVHDRATANADEVAIVEDERALTYAELLESARRFAGALVADGVGPRDRVAVWAPNGTEWIVSVLGIHLAGATLIPVNTRFKGFEASDLLQRGRVSVLVTVTDFLGTDYVDLLQSSESVELPDLRTIVVARGPATAPGVGWTDFLARATTADLDEVDRRRDAVQPDDPADILFTSGTTGVPKGVVSGQRQSLAVASDWARMTGLRRGDRYLMVNPYFHMFGLKAGILVSVMTGARMLPMPVFDAGRALALVEQHAVTVFPGPPTLYQSVLDHPDRDHVDLSSLRVAVTGAADIPVELIRRIYAELPFDVVVSGYGLTEAGTAASTAHDDSPETIATTVGRARPGFEIRLVDSFDVPVPAGAVGQILVRGPSVMSGYLDEPATTESVLTDDGWLRTGDLGTHLPDGTLRIVGRTKEMFLVGGFNAYPAEIEQILMRHPAISAAAVVAVPDERLGEVGTAFVVAREPLDAASVIAWAREHMANYKVPRFVTVLDDLPLTATGKVHKSALHQRAITERTS
ncbi:AMP-binding protein [Aeromicrobium choanae]|uniref:Acyl-CoA synthetase (AMP-forming)/AMP-acid ligase II n=1 Tax=Aeromicrobium choanae TaxID=1736691 RepID=A0A1T4YWY1_9ACTN|nr:AMP-binding protein [Aeromicrobium choanae]SKB06153.1 Acyl-CoA synthetase (AMP-forming)/AMP-acid ligase II [Aeromicrobium choanae]